MPPLEADTADKWRDQSSKCEWPVWYRERGSSGGHQSARKYQGERGTGAHENKTMQGNWSGNVSSRGHGTTQIFAPKSDAGMNSNWLAAERNGRLGRNGRIKRVEFNVARASALRSNIPFQG